TAWENSSWNDPLNAGVGSPTTTTGPIGLDTTPARFPNRMSTPVTAIPLGRKAPKPKLSVAGLGRLVSVIVASRQSTVHVTPLFSLKPSDDRQLLPTSNVAEPKKSSGSNVLW